MTDSWLDALEQLRRADEIKQVKSISSHASSSSHLHEEAAAALKQSEAHKLLRQVRKVLLRDNGTIDIFDESDKYDRVISLVWQGTISKARRPDREDPADFNYIMIGAKGKHLYVNNKPLKKASPEALKAALLKAAQKPLVQKRS
ncbi:MAG: hypothetical protein KDJ65_02980 [Anaerolineae bacterium]|nr:hypothetical protein [Anaerolineae bacterium]